jgi:hypothetical protein
VVIGTIRQGEWDLSSTTLKQLRAGTKVRGKARDGASAARAASPPEAQPEALLLWLQAPALLLPASPAPQVINFPVVNHSRQRGLLHKLRYQLMALGVSDGGSG